MINLSECRAYRIVGADRTMVRYRSCRPPDTDLRERLASWQLNADGSANQRLFFLLRREGKPSGINRIHCLYREEGRSVRALSVA